MRQFNSFAQWGKHLQRASRAMPKAIDRALNRFGKDVTAVAKAKFGTYQSAYDPGGNFGPFPAWDVLAPSTQAQRVALGYTPNDPLLRSGAAQASVSYDLGGTYRAEKVTLGSTDPNMLYQEYGTIHIPPRPVIGPAMAESRDKAGQRLIEALETVLERTA